MVVGYDITKPDPFKVFMEKTLEPLETQSGTFEHASQLTGEPK